MNAIPWTMAQLLADEHRHELASAATRRRRVSAPQARPHRGLLVRLRSHDAA